MANWPAIKLQNTPVIPSKRIVGKVFMPKIKAALLIGSLIPRTIIGTCKWTGEPIHSALITTKRS